MPENANFSRVQFLEVRKRRRIIAVIINNNNFDFGILRSGYAFEAGS